MNEILSENQSRHSSKRRYSRSSKSMADSIIGDFVAESDIRLIFLDVDGTINHLNGGDEAPVGTVCPDCVNILRQILDQTDSKIVLSTSWRLKRRHKKTLFRYLRTVDIAQGMIVGETRDLSGENKNRTDEIKDWLENPYLYHNQDELQPGQIQSWVSLDDLDLAELEQDEELKSNYIMLDPKLGLCKTENIVTRVVQQMGKISCWYQDTSYILPTMSTTSTGWSGRSSVVVLRNGQETHNRFFNPSTLGTRLSRLRSRSLRGSQWEFNNPRDLLMRHGRSMTTDGNSVGDSYSLQDDDNTDFEHQRNFTAQPSLGVGLEKASYHPARRSDWRIVSSRYKRKKRNLPRSQSHPLLPSPPSLREEQDIFQDSEELESSAPEDQMTSDGDDEYFPRQKLIDAQGPHHHSTTSKSKVEDMLTPSVYSALDGAYDFAAAVAGETPVIERVPLIELNRVSKATTSSGQDHTSVSNSNDGQSEHQQKVEQTKRRRTRKTDSSCIIRYPAPQPSTTIIPERFTYKL